MKGLHTTNTDDTPITIYHFTDYNIDEFKHTKPKRDYSQASGKGIYFATDYEKGLLKYGRRSKYCYTCEFTGSTILDLGEYDSMYFDNRMANSSTIVSENFKRYIQKVDEIPEPDIWIEKISLKAFNWLKKRGIQAVKGMDSKMYFCPEFCVIDSNCIRIIEKLELKHSTIESM